MRYSTEEYLRGKAPGLGWIKTCIGHGFNLIRVIIDGYPGETVKYFITQLFAGMALLPFLAIFIGKKRAINICKRIHISSLPGKVALPMPYPLKGKVILKEKESAYHNIYSDDECRKELLKKGMIVIDIGAYVGLYACMASEIVGSEGKVIAVEPNPRNYKQLIENININKQCNIEAVNMAAAEQKGTARLFFKHHGTVSSLKGSGDSTTVSVTTVDDIAAERGLKKIDVIKIDVEGYEINVLRGAERTLKENPKITLIVDSYHYHGEENEIKVYLESRDFETELSPIGVIFALPGKKRHRTSHG